MTTQYLLTGFGGQGILFMGKVLAYIGITDNKQVSWLPSYGPEMRGGTANCSVIISDNEIGSPIVSTPDVLVAMNLPSLDKYEKTVKSGGTIFVESSLISRKVERTDVNVVYIPATNLADENQLKKLANMIMMGSVLKMINPSEEIIDKTLQSSISARHANSLPINKKALEIGKNFNQ